MATGPWSRFAVDERGTGSNWTNCQTLETVMHVAHVPTAVRIIEDKKLRADLVYDKSVLNTERIRVVWLSPNHWQGAGGFRYGNIAFHFDWKPLVEGKRYYWVESIAYGIAACRLLVTTKDYSGRLTAYDPSADNGPWRRAGGVDEWNGDVCLEIMLEDDLPLDTLKEVSFVRHHDTYCNVDYRTCPYRGWRGEKGGAQFLASLVSRTEALGLPGLVEGGTPPKATMELAGAASILIVQLQRLAPAIWGNVGRDDALAPALARAVFHALSGRGLVADAVQLSGLFSSQEELVESCKRVIATAAGLPTAGSVLDV